MVENQVVLDHIVLYGIRLSKCMVESRVVLDHMIY